MYRRFSIRPHDTQTAGFTLLELLVVFAIILIMATISIQGFANYARTQQYTRFVEEVGHEIDLARQATLASKDDVTYGVYVGTSTIEFFAGATPVVGSVNNTIIDLSGSTKTATSSFSDSNWYITFSRLSGEASATGTILLGDTDLGRSASYTVRSSGLIELSI